MTGSAGKGRPCQLRVAENESVGLCRECSSAVHLRKRLRPGSPPSRALRFTEQKLKIV